jgi:murein DD-endopeptidase MepM/ murein hydrolase activator NlpD
MTDADGNTLSPAAVGQQMFLQVEYQATDLPTGVSYTISSTVDGVTLNDTLDWGAGISGTTFWIHRLGVWLAYPGLHAGTAVLDSTNTIGESNESDNSMTVGFRPFTVPNRFILPIAGTPYASWTIVNYVDMDLGSGVRDYHGGDYTYDGHRGIDYTLPNFAAMDRGVKVFAAAPGVVLETHDGEFDRNTSCTGTPNYVAIDHGEGWVTYYLHLRRNSVAVAVGQHVVAGQQIGLVGSSGCSTDAHLHFELRHDGDVVETYVDPSGYWISPLPYAGTKAGALDAGTTYGNPSTAQLKERPGQINAYAHNAPVWFWANIFGFKPGDQLTVRWTKPNGAIFVNQVWTVNGEIRYGWRTTAIVAPSSGADGIWTVALYRNGSKLISKQFAVTPIGRGLITGTVWNDLNANGVRESGEPPLAHWRLYFDDNHNGVRDPGEPSVLSNASGRYTFFDPTTGNHRIREELQSGWTPSKPLSGYYTVSFAVNNLYTGKDFGNWTFSFAPALSGADFKSEESDTSLAKVKGVETQVPLLGHWFVSRGGKACDGDDTPLGDSTFSRGGRMAAPDPAAFPLGSEASQEDVCRVLAAVLSRKVKDAHDWFEVCYTDAFI